MNHTLVQTIAGFALAATAIVAAPDARAASSTSYAFAGWVPQDHRETSTQLRIEGKDGAGNLVGTKYCPAGRSCPSVIPGAVNNVVVLEYEPGREEVTFERCKGVLSTVPQLRCENGDLEIGLRVRTGELVVKITGDTLLDTQRYVDGGRFEFAENAARRWRVPNNRDYDSTLKAYRYPAGSYKVYSPDLAAHCKPTQVDPGFFFDLPAGGRTSIEIRFRATECTVLFTTNVEASQLTMSSGSGPLTCEAKGQRGVPSVKSVCTGVFPFNQPVTVSATVPAGLEPYFEWVNNTCERTADPTTCRFKPRFDSALDIFTDITMTTRAAGAPPPPPPPVGLAFASSASSPSASIAAKGEAGVPMLQLQATAQNGTAMLQALTVKASGTGRDDLDLTVLKVVVDANGNGVFDAGETVLAQGRPTADNGELRLGFGSAIAVADTASLLVVADLASDVHSASAAALGGATVLLALGFLAMPASRSRRRFRPALVAAAVGVLVLVGCGGGSDEATTEPEAVAPPAVAPPVVVPPVLLTYRLDLIAVEATDTAAPAAPLTIRALPVAGATVTVQQ